MKKRAMERWRGNETSSPQEDKEGSAAPPPPPPPLPLEVVEEVLLHLPAPQVVLVCRAVCRAWRAVVDSDSLWRERCRREGYRPEGREGGQGARPPRDWRLFYFLSTKRRNLIKNCKADEKFSGWQILENGGDKWKIEPAQVPHPDPSVTHVFVTSYQPCQKCQVVDLQKEGYSPALMDTFQPHILVSDWYAPRCDCGSQYWMTVELLNQKKKPVQTFSSDTIYFQQWNDQKWNQISHVFQGYGPGVRYVRFLHGGSDSQFWAGWYGIRVTGSSVEVCPAPDR